MVFVGWKLQLVARALGPEELQVELAGLKQTKNDKQVCGQERSGSAGHYFLFSSRQDTYCDQDETLVWYVRSLWELAALM